MGKRLPEIKKITIRQRQVIRLCHKKEKLRNQREKGRGERMRKEKVTKMEGRKKEKWEREGRERKEAAEKEWRKRQRRNGGSGREGMEEVAE
jgi:hypothetical protein